MGGPGPPRIHQDHTIRLNKPAVPACESHVENGATIHLLTHDPSKARRAPLINPIRLLRILGQLDSAAVASTEDDSRASNPDISHRDLSPLKCATVQNITAPAPGEHDSRDARN